MRLSFFLKFQQFGQGNRGITVYHYIILYIHLYTISICTHNVLYMIDSCDTDTYRYLSTYCIYVYICIYLVCARRSGMLVEV